MQTELLKLRKSFPGVLAVDDVSLSFEPGKLHALVGENGAGKSTLMCLLYGMLRPDSGTIRIDGVERHFSGSQDAIAAGIGMVHQHFMLADTLTVTENMILGAEPTRFGRIDRNAAREALLSSSARFGLEIDPDALVGDLTVGQAQRVEILKVLYRGAEFLIFDEPTGVLSPQEVSYLFEILRQLAAQGKTIVLITHKLDEVLAIADQIDVMRRGRYLGRMAGPDADIGSLARMMVGRDVLFQVEKPEQSPGPVVLAVEDLSLGRQTGQVPLDDISFTIRRGEIFGIAGVEGNGQRELAEVICGGRPRGAGRISLGDRVLRKHDPRSARELGIRHVPADRHRQGLILDMDLRENMILGEEDSPGVSRWGLHRSAAIESLARRRIENFDVRTSNLGQVVGELSGGNQQKLILARELAHEIRLLVVAHPTRGVDVGAIEFIHRTLIELRSRGVAILLFSSELSELLALSDRIGVMYRGELVHTCPTEATNEQELGLWMTGAAEGGSHV